MRGQRQRASRKRGRARWLVVVEFPAKARTVGRFLGDGWRVLACHGHARDLPAKAGSVKPDEGFAMVYETAGRRAARALGAIRTALGDAEGLILATDPDREGEAIAWQVLTWLREKDALADKPVGRGGPGGAEAARDRSRVRAGDDAAARPARPLRPAGRRRGGEAPAHVGAGRHGSGRDRARGRAEAARAAARGRRPSRKRAARPGRHRPLRPLGAARCDLCRDTRGRGRADGRDQPGGGAACDREIRDGRAKGPKRVLRELGSHPDDGAPVWLKAGHYRPFVAHRRAYASVPADIPAGALTLERALALLDGVPGRRRRG